MKSAGVDLGTCAIRVAREQRAGIVRLAAVTAYDGDVLLAGDDAIGRAFAVREAMRALGRTVDDPIAQQLAARLGYPVVAHGDGAAALRVGSRTVHPLDLLVALVQRALEHAVPTDDETAVVCAVPSYFTDRSRAAVKTAFALAGADLRETLAAPVASAYALHGDGNTGLHAIVDLGGGGVSVSVVDIRPDRLELLGAAGSGMAGGEEMLDALAAAVLDALVEMHVRVARTPALLAFVRARCSAVVPLLGRTGEVTVNLAHADLGTANDDVTVRVTNTMRERASARFGELAEGAVRRAIENAGVAPGAIAGVYFSGGMSAVEGVVARIERQIGRAAELVAPDGELVVRGAARRAAMLVGEVPRTEVATPTHRPPPRPSTRVIVEASAPGRRTTAPSPSSASVAPPASSERPPPDRSPLRAPRLPADFATAESAAGVSTLPPPAHSSLSSHAFVAIEPSSHSQSFARVEQVSPSQSFPRISPSQVFGRVATPTDPAPPLAPPPAGGTAPRNTSQFPERSATRRASSMSPAVPLTIEDNGVFAKPTLLAEALALPLVRTITPADLAALTLPVLLRVVARTKRTGTLHLTNGDDALAIPVLEGRVYTTPPERTVLVAAATWPNGIYTFVNEVPVPGTRERPGLWHLYADLVRAIARTETPEDLAQALGRRMSLAPQLPIHRRADLERLGLSASESRVALNYFSPYVSADKLASQGGTGRRATLTLLLVLSAFELIEWDVVVPEPTVPLVEQVAAAAALMARGNHFDVLEVHWSSTPMEIRSAYDRWKSLLREGGEWATADAVTCSRMRTMVEAAYAVLCDEAKRIAYRKTVYKLDFDALAHLMDQRVRALELKGAQDEAVVAGRVAYELDRTAETEATRVDARTKRLLDAASAATPSIPPKAPKAS